MQALSAGIDATQHAVQEELTRATGSEQANETKIDNEILARSRRRPIFAPCWASGWGDGRRKLYDGLDDWQHRIRPRRPAGRGDGDRGQRRRVGEPAPDRRRDLRLETHLGNLQGPRSRTARRRSGDSRASRQSPRATPPRSPMRGRSAHLSTWHTETFTDHAQFTFPANATAKPCSRSWAPNWKTRAWPSRPLPR